MSKASSSPLTADLLTAATSVEPTAIVRRPTKLDAFEFAVLAGLRAGQLARGCTPRVACAHKITVTAQREVAAGKVVRQLNGEPQ